MSRCLMNGRLADQRRQTRLCSIPSGDLAIPNSIHICLITKTRLLSVDRRIIKFTNDSRNTELKNVPGRFTNRLFVLRNTNASNSSTSLSSNYFCFLLPLSYHTLSSPPLSFFLFPSIFFLFSSPFLLSSCAFLAFLSSFYSLFCPLFSSAHLPSSALLCSLLLTGNHCLRFRLVHYIIWSLLIKSFKFLSRPPQGDNFHEVKS